jgi:TonB-linked SusC/RagA family outer membrane protein
MRKFLCLTLLFMSAMASVFGQTRKITGLVVAENDVPLPGVSVSEKGKNTATVTNAAGQFVADVSNNAVLMFTYTGYLTQEVSVLGKDTLFVKMVLKDDAMEEVVVTGTGMRIDKRLFTGATTKISAEVTNIGGLPDPSRGLEGRVAGVTVQNVTGTFGTAPRMRIRGATSIYGSSKPLWVVDGVIIEDVADVSSDALTSGNPETLISSAVAGLNASDIQDFQILKDGSATAIYGARAMAGVIVITTKKGAAGRTSLNYRSELTYRLKPSYNQFNIMNSQDQMGVYQEMYERGWLRLAQTSNASNSGVFGKMYELINTGQLFNSDAARNEYLREAEYRNTDWFGRLFNDNIMQNHSISISGGTSKSQFYTSLSALLDPGWSKQSSVKRYTFNTNANFNLYKNLNLALQATGSFRQQKAPGTLGQVKDVVFGEVRRDFDINPYSYAMNTSRALDANTFYTRNYAPFNILHELENNYIDVTGGDAKFQGELKWKVIPSIELAALGSVRYQTTAQEHNVRDEANQATAYRTMPTTAIRDANSYLYTDPSNPYAIPISVLPQGGIYNRYDYKMLATDFRFTANYSKTIANKHDINAQLLNAINNTERQNTWFRGWGLQYSLGEIPFVDYRIFKRGQEENSPYYSMTNSRSRDVAFASFLNYTYNRKYGISGSYRYEGSNRLGRSRSARWMPTWSVGGLWNVYQEDFFESLAPTFSYFKIRSSYGLTGNRGPSNVTNSLVIIKSYSPWRPSTSDNESGLEISDLQNIGLTYEKKKEWNIGADWGFFNGRLNMTTDYYRRNMFDLIGVVVTQGIGGQIEKMGNSASMKSSGFEFSISGDIIKRNDFTWNASFNYAHENIKVTELNTTTRVIDLVTNTGFARVGYAPRGLFSIPFVKLNNEGLPVFIDQDNKESSTGPYFQERTLLDFLKYSGPTEPTDYGGFGNTFTYKNLSLNVYLTYSFGNVIRLDPVFGYQYNDLTATPNEFKNRWAAPGDELLTNIPAIPSIRQIRAYTDLRMAYNSYNFSDVRVAKGDFVRLKDVSLAYNIPQRILSSTGIKSLGARLNATNLLLLYADKNLYGQDPEFINTGGVAAPIPRQFTLTINAGF